MGVRVRTGTITEVPGGFHYEYIKTGTYGSLGQPVTIIGTKDPGILPSYYELYEFSDA